MKLTLASKLLLLLFAISKKCLPQPYVNGNLAIVTAALGGVLLVDTITDRAQKSTLDDACEILFDPRADLFEPVDAEIQAYIDSITERCKACARSNTETECEKKENCLWEDGVCFTPLTNFFLNEDTNINSVLNTLQLVCNMLSDPNNPTSSTTDATYLVRIDQGCKECALTLTQNECEANDRCLWRYGVCFLSGAGLIAINNEWGQI